MPVRSSSPSVSRNRDPILAVLAPLCDERRSVTTDGLIRILEIASGTGEHAAYFSSQLPNVVWQPSDLDLDGLESIDAHRLAQGAKNVLPPLCLDARRPFRLPGATEFSGLVCINMIHISPWSATLGLFENAEKALEPSGFVLLYGPYRRAGKHTAESNARFDVELRLRDPAWGVRNLEEVTACAEARGFSFENVTDMPRDNFTVVFRKAPFSRGGS